MNANASPNIRELSGNRFEHNPRVSKTSDTSLARYFRYIGNHKALNAAEELEAAKDVYELEHALWEAILSDRGAVRRLSRQLGDDAATSTRNDEKLFEKGRAMFAHFFASRTAGASSRAEIVALAEKLYEMDEDRVLVASAIEQTHLFIQNDGMKRQNDGIAYAGAVDDIARRVKEAKNHFIQENLGLVVNVAKRYHVEKMPLADLIQEGNIGLIRAVDKFDYKKGFRFSTYASWWIRSYISRAIVRKSNTVRIPEYMLRDRNRIKRTEEASRVKMGRVPNEEELATALGLSEKRLMRTRKHDVAYIESLDREVPGSDSQKYIDFLADMDERGPFENTEFSAWVRDIPKTLSKLSVTERFVVCWRFGLLDGEEMTLQEIGKCLNLSRERIRQIQEEALLKLRAKLEVDAA